MLKKKMMMMIRMRIITIKQTDGLKTYATENYVL
jgi:hypothetical protein